MDRTVRCSDKCVFARKIMIYFVVIVLFIACPFAKLNVAKAESKSAVIVMERESGRVLSHKNAQIRLPMASTTKILTAITVIENTDIQQTVTIPSQAVGIEGSSIYLKSGQKWKVIDLLYGLMLRSGNDSAVALAIVTSGSVAEFSTLMNRTAVLAGAYNSHFANPHGLHDKEHYTTAYDLAMITRYAMRSEQFSGIVSAKSHAYFDESGTKQIFFNKNKMLNNYSGADGVKTGFTKQSGRCLVSSATREDMSLICVVLNVGNMWQASMQMMDNCYSKYTMTTLAEKDKIMTYAKLKYNKGEVGVGVDKTLRYPLSQEEKANLRYEYSLINNRTDTNEKLYMGKVFIYHNNYLLFNAKLFNI